MSKTVVAKGSLVFVSAMLLSFLAVWEGDKQYTVYADPLANGLPTVCRGVTRHVTSAPIVVNDVWSAEKCLAEESAAIFQVQQRLLRCFGFEPPQSVFDMASSHAWNFGVSATCGSDAMAAWKRRDFARGCRLLARAGDGRPIWSFVRTGRVIDGKPEFRFVQGLANRRAAEVNNCLRDI